MPHPRRGTERRAVVARCRLDVDISKWCALADLAVGDAVHAAATGEAQTRIARTLPESVEHMECALLEHRLNGTRQGLVRLREGLVGPSRRAEEPLQFLGEHAAQLRIALVPLHLDAFAPMAEILEAKTEEAVGLEAHELAHRFHVAWRPVGREPHHLELVAVAPEAEVLRDRRVEQP